MGIDEGVFVCLCVWLMLLVLLMLLGGYDFVCVVWFVGFLVIGSVFGLVVVLCFVGEVGWFCGV